MKFISVRWISVNSYSMHQVIRWWWSAKESSSDWRQGIILWWKQCCNCIYWHILRSNTMTVKIQLPSGCTSTRRHDSKYTSGLGGHYIDPRALSATANSPLRVIIIGSLFSSYTPVSRRSWICCCMIRTVSYGLADSNILCGATLPWRGDTKGMR